jgi:hypothetical protein
MQNSKIKAVQTKVKALIYKLKVAYKFLLAPKAFVVIGKEIKAYKTSDKEVFSQCEQIHNFLLEKEIEKEEQRIDQAVKQLVYLN